MRGCQGIRISGAEVTGEVELGAAGDQQPGPAVGGGGVAQHARVQPSCCLRNRKACSCESPEVALPQRADQVLAGLRGRGPQPHRGRAARPGAGQAEEERRAAVKAAAYGKRLDNLAGRAEAVWQDVTDLIETKKPRDYDLAVSLLRDLSALARRDGHHDSFTTRFLELRSRHERKPSLQERFDKAGLPRRP